MNAAIAKMNLFLHGASDFNVMQGDTLRDPKILQGGNIAKFDCVIANPHFLLKIGEQQNGVQINISAISMAHRVIVVVTMRGFSI